MTKVFISQPMSGLSEDTIVKERALAIRFLKEKYGDNVRIVDSYFKDAYVHETPCTLLGMAIQKLGTADVAYFVKGWEKFRGCRLEHEIAQAYGIPTLEA